MKKTLVWRTAFVCTLLLTGQHPATGQEAEDFLDQSPFRVQPSDPPQNGFAREFGSAVALDGDVLVVGAPQEDSVDDPGVFNSGAVYVFEREGAYWIQRQRLTAPVEIGSQQFGLAVGVALGDAGVDYLIVGGPFAGGGAYIFKRMAGGMWEYDATLSQDDPQLGDRFGASVAIDFFEPPDSQNGDKVFVAAVGAPSNRAPAGTGSQEGSVSVFQPAGSPPSWGGPQEFFGTNGDLVGSSLGMAGPNIVAGAFGLDGTGFNGGGALIFSAANQQPSGVYKYNYSMMVQPSVPEVGVGQDLSVAAAYDPTILGFAALGFPLSDESAFNAGIVLMFSLSPGPNLVTESAVLQPVGLGQGARFGASVALSDRTLAVGAPGEGTDGTVFLYERGASLASWDLVGTLTLPALPPVGPCSGGSSLALGEATAVVGCPTSSSYQNEGTFVYSAGRIFADFFMTGDDGAWTASVP